MESKNPPPDYLFHLDNTDSFRSLVENGSDLIGIIDRNGDYLYVANNSKALLGYEASYFVGKNTFSFIHPDDVPEMVDKLKEMEYLKTVDFKPFRFRAANGEWRWIESTLTNLLENPSILGMVINSRDVTEKMHLQRQLRNEIASKERQVTRAVLHAQEKERQNIGAELHDNVNQLLSSVKLYLSVIIPGNAEGKGLIGSCSETIQSAIDEIRNLSRRLVGPEHQGLGLEQALRALLASFAIDAKTHYHYDSRDLSRCGISEETELAVYRVAQEQLTNIYRHAAATEVDLSLTCVSKRLHLKVSDNGRGFDLKDKKEGIGISNMRSRAMAVNGNLEFISSPGEGCTLYGNFPVE